MANTQHIINFIREVGLQVHERSLSDATFLPGISIERGELVADLGIDASEVFHEEGYKGAGESLVENFEKGGWVGVPLLGLIFQKCMNGSVRLKIPRPSEKCYELYD